MDASYCVKGRSTRFSSIPRRGAFLGKNRIQAPELNEVIADIRNLIAEPLRLARSGPARLLARRLPMTTRPASVRERILRLSGRDAAFLLKLLRRPARPNPKLADALRDYRNRTLDAGNSVFDWKPQPKNAI